MGFGMWRCSTAGPSNRCAIRREQSDGEAWHGAETANRPEDSLIDDPACTTPMEQLPAALLSRGDGFHIKYPLLANIRCLSVSSSHRVTNYRTS
jgi:hypothetical protein